MIRKIFLIILAVIAVAACGRKEATDIQVGKRTLSPWAIVFRHWQTNWIYCK